MARRTFRGGRPLGRGARLRKTWCRRANTDVVALTSSQAEILSCSHVEASGAEFTVLRTRGHYLLVGTPDAVTDSEVVGLGIAVVPNSAVGVGGLSLPGPIADIDSDIWLWHALIPLEAGSQTAVDSQSITTNFRGVIDSKGMRKWPSDSSVVLIGELSIGAFAGVEVLAGVQFLAGS